MAENFNQHSPEAADSIASTPHALRFAAWAALLVAVAVGAGLLGIVSAGLLRRDRDSGRHTELPAAGPLAVAPPPPPLPVELLVPDPASPLPEGTAALIAEATRVVERLLETYPNNTDSLEMKARLDNWLGRSEEAVKTWQRCLELDPRYAHAYVGMADVALKKGDYPKAEQLAAKALDISPESFQARAVLAESRINLGRPEEAVAVLDDFLKRDPRSFGYFLLGRAYAQRKQFEKAKQSYAAAVRQYPDYGEAFFGLANACARLGQNEEAAQAMARYRELMGKRQPDRQGMGTASGDSQWVRQSVSTLYTDTARVYLVQGKRREAESLWQRAAALDAENLDCRQALAFLYQSEGRTEAAIQLLEDLARIEPDNPSYWVEIGRLRTRMLQLDLAENALREACRVAPENGGCHAALASVLLRAGRNPAGAVAAASAAVDRQPTAANYALLALARRAAGDRAGALVAVEQAVRQEPEFSGYRELEESIRAER